MSRFIDVHADKRKALNLFQAVEPCVEFVGSTVMVGEGHRQIMPNEIPGYVARMSHDSKGTPEDNVRLTKKLLTFSPPHATPFEFMQWVFKITGVSKSCLTQFDRNRIGIGFVQMSGRYMDSRERGFVYTAFEYKPWEEALTGLLFEKEANEDNIRRYETARDILKFTKQDARKRMPMAMATGTYVHMNSRSLKTFFNERLRPSAEWEIRRCAQMIFDIVYSIAPAHFEQEKMMLDGSL